jgi:hypothetical protein
MAILRLFAAAALATIATACLWAAEPKTGSTADAKASDRPETEIDISGPYDATIDADHFPSQLEIWGPKATLKISMDGQDRPMVGMFMNDQLKVVSKYGAENFNLTTMVEAKYDGRNFVGRYSRADEKLGLKTAKIVLTPDWHGGGGGAVKMPLPRRPADIPGRYGLSLKKEGGGEIATSANVKIEDGIIKLDAGGRRYMADYSDKQIAPVFWEGNRMDIFHLTPTETGFKGTLVKETSGKAEKFDVLMGKGRGGGGDDDWDWTFVYDVIFAGQPPVYIGKLRLHEDDARLVVELADGKADMKGSLVEGILSATGRYANTVVSIRAEKNAHGFAGAYRQGAGALVREVPVVLKNRPVRAGRQTW